MNLFSLLSFTSFLMYCFLGIYTVKLDLKNRTIRVFLILVLSLSWWALSYTFVYPAASKSIALLWMHLASIGVFFIPGILLHFTAVFTHPHKRISLVKRIILYYSPGIIFNVKSLWQHGTVADIHLGRWGWMEIVNTSDPWFWIFNCYYLIYLLTAILLIIYWGIKSARPRQKKQARLISITISITMVASFLSDLIFPALGVNLFPSVAPAFFLILAGGLWTSIIHFRMLTITPEIAADEIISRINEFLIFIDSEGFVTMANNKVYAELGYSAYELKEMQIGQLLQISGIENADLTHMINTKKQYEFNSANFITSRGKKIPGHLFCTPIPERYGELEGVMIVGHDLRMIRQLQTLKKEKEFQDLKSRFISIATQDFNSPLLKIQDSIDIIQDKFSELDQESRDTNFQAIYASVKTMKNLLSDVLTLEKTSAADLKLDYQEVELHSFFDPILNQDADHIINIDYEMSPQTRFYTDPRLMNNILLHLLDNSLKYSPQKMPIDILLKQSGEQLSLTVKDSGIGIQEKDMPRIFNSFHRGSNTGGVTGTGLGLSIVKRSVDLLQGTISINTIPDKGTSIDVQLPLHKSPPIREN